MIHDSSVFCAYLLSVTKFKTRDSRSSISLNYTLYSLFIKRNKELNSSVFIIEIELQKEMGYGNTRKNNPATSRAFIHDYSQHLDEIMMSKAYSRI